MQSELLGTTSDERALARRAWSHLEVVHAVGIFGPDVTQAHRELGIADPISGYVAARVGPMGAVGPEVATAVFHSFSPVVMQRTLPAVWDVTEPATVVEATRSAAASLLERLTEGLEDEVVRAAELAREATLFHPLEGRPLAAARTGVPWASGPHAQLWEAATRVREARGDGHVACLVVAGIDGVEAHLTVAGDTREARSFLKDLQGWTEPEWEAAVRRLAGRGLLDDQGRLTDEGRALRDELEARTDALSVPPWRQLGEHATHSLIEALRPIVHRILDAEILPLPVFAGNRDVDPRGPGSPRLHTDAGDAVD